MQQSVSKTALLVGGSVLVLFVLCLAPAHAVFINEIHYDNVGADVGEAIELTGEAGQDLAGWSLLFYNGKDGAVYKSYALTGVFEDQQQGLGVLGFALRGIQNGAADGVALVDAADNVRQFLSYEGRLRANSGAAKGLLSTDIGVQESGATPVGYSLQLRGEGRTYTDFSWFAAKSSLGEINDSQSFVAPMTGIAMARSIPVSVAEPATGFLLPLGLVMVLLLVCGRNGRSPS